MAKVTVRQAARLVGKDRTTLYRYIEDGALSVEQENRGKQVVRVIDTAELERVFGSLHDSARQEDNHPKRPATTGEETAALQVAIDALRRENDLLQRQLEEARADKERLFRLLEDQRATVAPQQRSWPGLIARARRIVYGDDRGTGGAA